MLSSPIITVSLMSALAISSPVAQTSEPTAPPQVAIANILPADTPLVGLVNTKAAAWTSLNRFYLFDRAFTAGAKFLPSTFKFDYARDVEPLLAGPVMFAFLPKVEGTTATIDNNFVVLVPVKNESLIQPFLDSMKEDSQRVKVREYKGITILEMKPPESPKSPSLPKSPEVTPSPELPEVPPPIDETPKTKQLPALGKRKLAAMPDLIKPDWFNKQRGFAIATLPGYVVTGMTAKSIEQVIDASQGDNTLAKHSQFQQTIGHPQYGKSLFTIYENLPTFVPLINDITKDPSLPFPIIGTDTINLDQLKNFGSVNGFLTIEPEGLRFQATAYRQTPKSEQDAFVVEKQEAILSRLPGATYSTLTGRNLNQKWQLLTEAISTKPQLKDWLTQLRSFVRTSTGLDLEKDITNWMDGDYAFFLFPSKGGVLGSIPNLNLGIGMAVQTNNRTAAENTLKKLDEFIKSFSTGGVVVNTHNLKGQTITSWDVAGDSSQSLLAYNWADDNTVIVTTGFGAIQDLVPQPYVKLPATYNFQTATNSLPRPNYGYFYLNGGSTLSWIYGFLPTILNDQTIQPWKPIIGSVYSLSATTATTSDREQFDFLMVLAPTRKPVEPVKN
ncbi:DUF3352 domain-containing protein [Nostoc sp. FACHB-152]|uniref:DUF3352 domain-containing protein n=1 Tax=unclassified Nostoc TaxID=2593658 RepID=UPI001683BEF7|nr:MULTISPECIES: DUF3352 domain-containing protein [unclassified Nostoc]MBD2445814.1 DUF3352 domain-containing protein [Nostoc sp. FACHB-152]MBD2468011.1 DUF3352 domain-containing protein [Nostoc sp. FACHB-145]